RKRERLKDIREEHSVYRELYEDLRELIKKQSIEHGKLRTKIYRLERAFEEIHHCVYRRHCPLLRGLPFASQDRADGATDTDGADRTRGDPVA
ncbi:MAG: hypothetical protein ACRC9Q_10790, partial [Bacteroidales bacterium]